MEQEVSPARKRFEKLVTAGRNKGHDNEVDATDGGPEVDNYDDVLAVFNDNILSLFSGMLTGLLCLMYVPSIVKVLHKTGRSDNPERAFKRYLRTINHMMSWFTLGEAERSRSLAAVRRLHRAANAVEPMSQFDMVVTQWAFVGLALAEPTKIGMHNVADVELDSIRRVMLAVGRSLGVDDDLNLCSFDNLDDSREYCDLILREVIRPSVADNFASPLSSDMAGHMLDGLKMFNPFILRAGTMKRLAYAIGLPELPVKVEGAYATAVHNVNDFMFDTAFRIRPVDCLYRPTVNNLLRLNLWLANRLTGHIVVPWRRRIIVFFVYVFVAAINLAVPFLVLLFFWTVVISLEAQHA